MSPLLRHLRAKLLEVPWSQVRHETAFPQPFHESFAGRRIVEERSLGQFAGVAAVLLAFEELRAQPKDGQALSAGVSGCQAVVELVLLGFVLGKRGGKVVPLAEVDHAALDLLCPASRRVSEQRTPFRPFWFL